jgi:glycosyltransferase involved in cell wall biosynthesis
MTRIGPKLSLGIPVHNGAAYLAQLFDCLRAQTLTDFEAIILDNASTDATEQICRRMTAADPRFRYERNQRNIGAAPNFNRVFEQATGRYFKWTAHDDLMAPTYLERCVAVLDEDPSVSVCHAAIQVVNAELQPLSYDSELGRYVDVDGTPALLYEPAGLATSPDPARRFDDVLHGMRLCSEIFGVMRTDLLRRTSLHGSYYGSDKVLLAELALLGRIETVPEPLFIKRFHKDTSYYLTTRERAAWIDPAASFRVPQIQVLKGYLKALSLVPLTPVQRARCLGSVARKVLNTQALRRLLLPSADNYFGIERRSPRPAAVSNEAKRLQRRLEKLSAPQLEALLTRIDIDRTRLAPAEAEPAKRIATLVRYLDFDNLARFRAWGVLDQIKFYKRPLPHGLLPVDDGLRARELAREDERVARVAASGRDPSEGRTTPEHFYTFRRDAAWLGIFRDWDVRRAFHAPLMACVRQLFSTDAEVRIAGLIGQGGTGKSVALRRLAVDMAAAGIEVWWVEDQSPALDLGLLELAGLEDGRRRLVLIDDAQRLEAKDVRQLRELLARTPEMVAVVAGRDVPVGLQNALVSGKNLFVPDEATDQPAILARIAGVLPEWAEPARALAAEPMRQAHLVRLLVILAHGRARLPRTLEELELRFREVLTEEIFRVKDVHPGFAQALLFAAMVRSSGYDLSRPSMIGLADYYQPGTSFLSLLDPDNHGWSLAGRLTFHDTIHDTIVFHHDELAEGVVEAGLQGSFEPWVAFGDAWLRKSLAKLVQVGSARSRSLALDGLTRMFPDLLSGDELRAAIKTRSSDGRALSGAAS